MVIVLASRNSKLDDQEIRLFQSKESVSMEESADETPETSGEAKDSIAGGAEPQQVRKRPAADALDGSDEKQRKAQALETSVTVDEQKVGEGVVPAGNGVTRAAPQQEPLSSALVRLAQLEQERQRILSSFVQRNALPVIPSVAQNPFQPPPPRPPPAVYGNAPPVDLHYNRYLGTAGLLRSAHPDVIDNLLSLSRAGGPPDQSPITRASLQLTPPTNFHPPVPSRESLLTFAQAQVGLNARRSNMGIPAMMPQFSSQAQPGSQALLSMTLPKLLAQPTDEEKLSRHQVLLRRQIEAFQAADEDVATHTRGRNKPITLGQVGIRCKHCAHLPVAARRKGSTYFPAGLMGLYQAAQNMSTSHMQNGTCGSMPASLKDEFARLANAKVTSSGAGRPYWANSARKLGLVDTDMGIRLIRDIPPGAQIMFPSAENTRTSNRKSG